MQHIKRILVATDLSEESAKVEQRAGILSEDLKCWILELLAVEEDRLPAVVPHAFGSHVTRARSAETERRRASLNAVAEMLQCNFRVRCNSSVRFGQPALEILNKADEIKADLVIIGARGSGYAGDISLGRNADKFLCMATRPVLIVKNQPARSYQEVLIPVDFSSDAKRAAQVALQLAPHAHITFLHAVQIPYGQQMLSTGACAHVIDEQRCVAVNEVQRSLDGLIGELELRTHRVTHVIRYGPPVDEIIRYAAVKRPDLIAMGKHGGSSLPELLLGSVARRVLTEAFSDIVVATSGRNVNSWQGPHAA